MNSTKKTKAELTQELLAKVLKYDPLSGTLIWISNFHSKSVVPNSRAGYLKKSGYRGISLFGATYAEHHLIWFIYYGVWPKVSLTILTRSEMTTALLISGKSP